MALDLNFLSTKLKKYRENFLMTQEELSEKSGIAIDKLNSFEAGVLEPSGDEILILADIYRCDYKYFISSESEPDFDKIEQLFRKHKNDLQANDRWAIQECIFFAENETFLEQELKNKIQIIDFAYQKEGTFFKKHGYDTANKLRELLYPSHHELSLNIYDDFKKIGINIYRRKLENSNISGITLKHSSIGKFILVNYNEDIFRQRFTVAHEAAHAIFDLDNSDDFLSISKWDKNDLAEIRANTFASTYLLPQFVLDSIPENKLWSSDKLVKWAIELKVSVSALLIALKERNFINDVYYQTFKHISIPSEYKIDPELKGLSGKTLERKKYLLEKGISQTYINKCKAAYEKDIISASKMAEMLLIDINELYEINALFQLGIRYEN
ncbi:MAG: XRE family transcriptional regulator [Treponema sp.]|jgi:Zn-dependent peptidase ImmA (M78 family)|nr:XRE family transcriptional regulator [Treponema sp.]